MFFNLFFARRTIELCEYSAPIRPGRALRREAVPAQGELDGRLREPRHPEEPAHLRALVPFAEATPLHALPLLQCLRPLESPDGDDPARAGEVRLLERLLP